MKRERLTVRATITGFNAAQGWWYFACCHCYTRVKPSGPAWWCDSHAHIKEDPKPWSDIFFSFICIFIIFIYKKEKKYLNIIILFLFL